jgi:hypothetical protein
MLKVQCMLLYIALPGSESSSGTDRGNKYKVEKQVSAYDEVCPILRRVLSSQH